MYRRPACNVLRGALTNRPYQPTVSTTSRSAASSANFAANPCFSVDSSIVKDDSFDFWAYREKNTQEREKEFQREREQLINKYTQKDGSSSFRKFLEIALSAPTFRETVGLVLHLKIHMTCNHTHTYFRFFFFFLVFYVLMLETSLLYTFKLFKKEKHYVVNQIMFVQFN